MYYILPGVQLESARSFPSFQPFAGEPQNDLPLCRLTIRHTPYPLSPELRFVQHGSICVAELPDGWLYLPVHTQTDVLYVSREYRTLTAYTDGACAQAETLLPLIRTALECASIAQGVLSLHSACVEWNGQGICFTAASGVGKSTRAICWQRELGATMISGDRPSICLGHGEVRVHGVPWDGKEQLFRDRSVPLRAILYIRRGDSTYIRKLSPTQARNVLCQQCFLPLWDTEAAVGAMALIGRLCTAVPIYRVTCGPDEKAAVAVRNLVFYHPERIKEAEPEMKIKNGFILRDVAGEHIVMPTGKNIRDFDGAIVLNTVAAFAWEKLCAGCSREELLLSILSEFDVDRPRTEADLDMLLEKLRGYQVLDEETV